MTITNSLRKILDRKQWEMCAPAPIASVAGSFIVSSLLDDQLQLYMPNVTTPYLYDPKEDAWQLLPGSGLAGTFGAGSAGCYHHLGPSGTATAGSATSLTTNLTIPGSLAGYKVRITGGAGAGREETILSNTYGANSVLTFATGTAIDATSTYVLITGRFYVFCGANVTQGLRYYDVATNTWSAALSVTGVTATFATDAKLRATPGIGADFATGTATAGASTTLTNSAKTWATNQWTNFQVRITGGTGAGQTRTIASNTGTVLTVSAAWTVTPDATSVYAIEGNNDHIYLAGNNAVTMFRYSISGNTWTTLAPGVARGGAPGAGMSLQWIRTDDSPLWTNESAIINGRRLYSFRGAAGSLLDYYDIPTNAWTAVTYQRQGEVFGAGSGWDNAGNGHLYGHKDATSRFFRFDVANNTMDPFSTLPYPQGAALVGDRLFTIDFVDGGDVVKYLYMLRNSGSELFRCLIF
jgi:hypothetical protein